MFSYNKTKTCSLVVSPFSVALTLHAIARYRSQFVIFRGRVQICTLGKGLSVHSATVIR